jgi:RimJ/RimL family protein N-acetyltransferase
LKNKELYFKFITKKDSTFIRSLYNSEYSKIALSETSSDQYPFTKSIINEWVYEICENHKYLRDRKVLVVDPVFILIYSKNQKIGFVQLSKINKKSKTAEIGIIIKKEFHGKGIGSASINRICDFIFKNFNFKSIKAFIREDNIASINMFEKCSFVKINRKEKHFVVDNFYNFNIFTLKNAGNI